MNLTAELRVLNEHNCMILGCLQSNLGDPLRLPVPEDLRWIKSVRQGFCKARLGISKSGMSPNRYRVICFQWPTVTKNV